MPRKDRYLDASSRDGTIERGGERDDATDALSPLLAISARDSAQPIISLRWRLTRNICENSLSVTSSRVKHPFVALRVRQRVSLSAAFRGNTAGYRKHGEAAEYW